jgi:hypothetical protein
MVIERLKVVNDIDEIIKAIPPTHSTTIKMV